MTEWPEELGGEMLVRVPMCRVDSRGTRAGVEMVRKTIIF